MSLKSKTQINEAAGEAERILALASETAISKITQAASTASSVIASAAAEAVKLLALDSKKNSDDHDLLVELKTQMKGLKEDIKNLRDEQFEKVNGHETRLNALERTNIQLVVGMSVGGLWLGGLTAMLVYHLFKVPLQ